MRRTTWIAVALTAAVLAGVTALAFHGGRRDRAALVQGFSDEQLSRLRIAIREIESDLAGVRQHLEFATRLVHAAKSGGDQRRELEALLAVVRSYRAIVVFDAEGNERVVATDPLRAGSLSRAPFSDVMRKTALTAMSRQAMAISEPLADAASPWHRAFATPLSRDARVQGAVAILVDQAMTFERLRLVAPWSSAKLILLGPHGRQTPLTDPALAAASVDAHGGLEEVVRRMRAGHTGTEILAHAEARALGMTGHADAVAVFAPIRTEDAGHWSIAVLDSTAGLQSQEDAIFLRMAVLAAVFAVALGALTIYLVVSARRAISVQERLRGAEEVAHVREKAEKMLENVPVVVVALEGHGRISGLNVAARERIPCASVGGTIEEAFRGAPPDRLESVRRLIEEARSSGRVQRIIAEPLAISGSHFTVHAVPLAHPLPDIELLLVLEDVTELRALASQLLRAEKLATVGVLSAGIAHEVGTPLGVMRGRAEMLVAKLGDGHPQGDNARIIVDEIDRISRIIQELLDFSRMSPAPGGTVALASVASNVVELLAFEARTRKVSVVADIARGLEPLAANADQLKQVLVNLTLNAVHACAPGGHVKIRARADSLARRAVIDVLDDGSGIPDELRHRVFDPFFTTKKRGKGTGLGLTVAAHIVRNHGGDIDLESVVGEGTRVVISWPLSADGVEEHHGEPERRANPRR